MPAPFFAERPYLAPPKHEFSGPIFGLNSSIFVGQEALFPTQQIKSDNEFYVVREICRRSSF